jgi:hypothetical protein
VQHRKQEYSPQRKRRKRRVEMTSIFQSIPVILKNIYQTYVTYPSPSFSSSSVVNLLMPAAQNGTCQ